MWTNYFKSILGVSESILYANSDIILFAFVLVIDLTNEKTTFQPIEYWLKDLQVYIEVKQILLEGGWLSDNLITAVQR